MKIDKFKDSLSNSGIQEFAKSISDINTTLAKASSPLLESLKKFSEQNKSIAEFAQSMDKFGNLPKGVDFSPPLLPRTQDLPINKTALHTANTAKAVEALVDHTIQQSEKQATLAEDQERIARQRHQEQMLVNHLGVSWAKYACLAGVLAVVLQFFQIAQSYFQKPAPILVESKVDLRELTPILEKLTSEIQILKNQRNKGAAQSSRNDKSK